MTNDPFSHIREPKREPIDRTLEPSIQTRLGPNRKRAMRIIAVANMIDGLFPSSKDVSDSSIYVGLSPIQIRIGLKRDRVKAVGVRIPIVIKGHRIHWYVPISLLIAALGIVGLIYGI